MRVLPFAMTRGKLLTQIIREAHQDSRRHGLCGYCGARLHVKPERPQELVRCPACMRLQRVAMDGETPWRLTAASAEALRRTKSWTRYCC